MSIRALSFFALFFASTASVAGPAPYYWWVSQLDGSRACFQTPLGPGWIQEPKPFRDVRCRLPYTGKD